MKKITLLLLLSSGFIMAQTKQVVTKFGEIVNINPFVNNGLEANNGYIQLGGPLTHPSALKTSPSNTLKILGLQTGTALDSILVNDTATGILKKVASNDLIANAWTLKGNTGTSAANFIGTTDAQNLIFKTNSVERMRMLSTGFIGIGTTTPTTALEVTASANPLKLNGLQTGATSDQLLTVNASGVVRQQTVSSIVAAGTTHTLGLSGSTLTSTVNGIAPTVNLSTLPIAGDVTGTLAASTVAKINGSPLGTTTGAVTGARLMYNGTQWLPTTSPDWSLTGNAGTNASTNFLGTTDNNDLVFKTSNNERVRVGTNGFMGIGLATGNNTTGTTPNYMLDVIDDIHISSQRAGASTRLILENQGNTPNNALGIFMLDGQSTGSRRQWYLGKAYLAQGTGGNDNFIISSGLTDVVNSGYAGALSAGVSPHFYIDAKNNRIGINTINPANTLEINSTANPLKLDGLQTGAKTDKILTVDTNGVVHKSMAMSSGRVQCDGTGTLTVNDPNITAASSVMLTIQDPTGTAPFVFSVMEGARVPGSSFSIKFVGIMPGPSNTYWVNYLVIY
ncbi:hypothetical protein [Flavobacterium sp. H4147]|uniref:hypothetical protein n=1 Tax=Flavobacterium sp. H4147 TaxID=3034149 RepID=UPI0023ED9AE7|nr:hypothetical protein [Flavobacterium sp. H4147]